MVTAPYERKNKKLENITVRAVKAYISKSILPTYGRFSRGRSHLKKTILYLKKQELIWKMIKLTYILRNYVMHVTKTFHDRQQASQ